MNQKILEIKMLSAKIGTKKILENINFNLAENQIVAIIGQSGCGKSTLLKVINRTFEEYGGKHSGDVLLRGKSIFSMPAEKLRQKIGLVFQTPVIFPCSIRKNMTYALRYHNKYTKKQLETLTREYLEKSMLYDEVVDHLDMPAKKLSGGQQQRLAIARCLSVQPEMILLDEPCSALDVKNTMYIEELLLKLKQEYTIVIVTHNLAQAKRIADQVVFMDQGEIVEENDTENFFSAPLQRRSQEYIRYMGN